MSCGSRTVKGHGDIAICGQEFYGDIYLCEDCQKRATDDLTKVMTELFDKLIIAREALVKVAEWKTHPTDTGSQGTASHYQGVAAAALYKTQVGYACRDFPGWYWQDQKHRKYFDHLRSCSVWGCDDSGCDCGFEEAFGQE